MAETVRPQGFPQFLPLSGLDYIREPTRKDRLSPTKYTEKNYVKVLYVFFKMILFSDETSEVVKVAVAVVMVVVAAVVMVVGAEVTEAEGAVAGADTVAAGKSDHFQVR